MTNLSCYAEPTFVIRASLPMFEGLPFKCGVISALAYTYSYTACLLRACCGLSLRKK